MYKRPPIAYVLSVTTQCAKEVIPLTDKSGQPVILNTARRVLREHQQEIKALADK